MKQALRYQQSKKITSREVNSVVYILDPISHTKRTPNGTSRKNNSLYTDTEVLQITAPNNNTVMIIRRKPHQRT